MAADRHPPSKGKNEEPLGVRHTTDSAAAKRPRHTPPRDPPLSKPSLPAPSQGDHQPIDTMSNADDSAINVESPESQDTFSAGNENEEALNKTLSLVRV
ncbi:hypothetical protein ColTof4_01160 [Colletotrichum tofieldiae]|nr:hypothetical protein ColTof4_01160 [Colletotrichum tofieldiae]